MYVLIADQNIIKTDTKRIVYGRNTIDEIDDNLHPIKEI